MVTAVLPPFAQPGQPLDVTVSSLGNAKSLRGGTLLMTPLKGADGLTYAVAQGNILVGGAGASAGGSKVQINHLAAGRVPDGATVDAPFRRRSSRATPFCSNCTTAISRPPAPLPTRSTASSATARPRRATGA